MLLLAKYREARYDALMQEDRAIEWATVGLFAVAGLIRLGPALRHRRVFDVLVALFCLFVAGEEMSWGQRLVGYQSPEAFLEHNAQQESTLHNLSVFGRPKWPLVAALAGYGMLLPLMFWLVQRARDGAPLRQGSERLLNRLGVTAPSAAFTPWFFAAVFLLVWYPVTYTGEWVEALAGALFLAASGSAGMTLTAGFFSVLLLGSVAFGLAMTRVSELVARRSADPALVMCVLGEVQALTADLTVGHAATSRLMRASSVHKRLWTSVGEGYVGREDLTSFDALAPCSHETAAESSRRRQFLTDPWGTAYWLRVLRRDPSARRGAPSAAATDSTPEMRPLIVYSFGADRRRDVESALDQDAAESDVPSAVDPASQGGSVAGADVRASGRLPRERLR